MVIVYCICARQLKLVTRGYLNENSKDVL